MTHGHDHHHGGHHDHGGHHHHHHHGGHHHGGHHHHHHDDQDQQPAPTQGIPLPISYLPTTSTVRAPLLHRSDSGTEPDHTGVIGCVAGLIVIVVVILVFIFG